MGTFEVKLNIHSDYPIRVVLYNSDSNLRTVTVPANTTAPITVSNLTVNNSLLYVNIFILNGSATNIYYIDNISLTTQ